MTIGKRRVSSIVAHWWRTVYVKRNVKKVAIRVYGSEASDSTSLWYILHLVELGCAKQKMFTAFLPKLKSCMNVSSHAESIIDDPGILASCSSAVLGLDSLYIRGSDTSKMSIYRRWNLKLSKSLLSHIRLNKVRLCNFRIFAAQNRLNDIFSEISMQLILKYEESGGNGLALENSKKERSKLSDKMCSRENAIP
ncbi:hypothetical protein AVEN_148270-1 [Araneus ventricosus]|uniref:Uncharacterized protein n=1 Tax=Araneus ventricosus TaxID=182803 RepID=A0A4Y2HKW1_ARAVE|nr:hypothetical protein AVEN_148270-1 [Araneus ventricosus]